MASLTGQTISTTYDSLLKLTDNGPITASFKEITDGLGNSSGVFVKSTGQIKLGNYTTTTSFTGTAAGYLAFTSAGEIITTAIPSGGITSLNALTASTQTFAVGTSGTDFAISSATSTHTFNLPTASGTNRGALSSADWTTFNNKQNALTNPVTGTGTTNYVPKFTGSTAIGNSLIFDNGTNVGIGTASPSSKLEVYVNDNSLTGTKVTNVSGGVGAAAITNYSNGISSHYFGTLGTSYAGYGVLLANEGFVYTAGQSLSLAADGANSIKFGTGTGTPERMRIDASGNVGIGTSTPTQKLDVNGNAVVLGFLQAGDASILGAPSYGLIPTAIIGKSPAGVLDIRNTNGTVNAGDTAGIIQFSVKGDATPGYTVARIDVSTQNNTTTGNSGGGNIKFLTSVGGTGAFPTERMRITNTGNVGIGTISPSLPLHVYNSAAALAYFESTNANGAYTIWRNSSNTFGDVGSALGISGSGSASDFMVASRAGSMILGTSSAERMRINSSGNVGIGTSSPAYKLDVNGSSIFRTWSSMAAGIPFAWNSVSGLYVATGYSAAINTEIADGAMTFFTAPSGTAGASATFSERMRITSAGIVCIANTAGLGGTLSVANTSGNSGIAVKDAQGNGSLMKFINSSGSEIGSITTNGFTTAYNVSSDYRLKQDLKDYSGLDLINEIKTYDYEWKANNSRMYGVLAHELQEVIPYAVAGEKDGENMQGVDYSKIVPILVKAIQELKAELDELKNNK